MLFGGSEPSSNSYYPITHLFQCFHMDLCRNMQAVQMVSIHKNSIYFFVQTSFEKKNVMEPNAHAES